MNESTVHCIEKNKKAIHKSVMTVIVPSTKVATQVRDLHIEGMEKALNVWVEDSAQKIVP